MIDRLWDDWSPERIAGRLLLDNPDNPRMHISHEAIYRAIYPNLGHKALQHNIHRHLRRRLARPKVIQREALAKATISR